MAGGSALAQAKKDLALAKKAAHDPAKYKLDTKHIHIKNVIDAMSVVWIRAAKPDWELWKVGVESNVSKTHSKKFNVNTTKRNDNNFDDLRNLESMTSRKYKTARHIVENAARGIFPNQSPCEHAVAFDPHEFRDILMACRKWMRIHAPSELKSIQHKD
jgi:hypothetical protein